jgi:hypothetical protein
MLGRSSGPLARIKITFEHIETFEIPAAIASYSGEG